MPLSPPFAESLPGTVVTISLQAGWGWQRKAESGAWTRFEPPAVLLPVKVDEVVQPAADVIGFSGVVEASAPDFIGLSLMALVHSADNLTAEDVVPLALALSKGRPKCEPDEAKLQGYGLAPEGTPAYLGFGILVSEGAAK